MPNYELCTRCWPKRHKTTYRGAFGYEALCDDCFATLDPDTEAEDGD